MSTMTNLDEKGITVDLLHNGHLGDKRLSAKKMAVVER